MEWVRCDYGELIDREQVTHSGQTVGEVLRQLGKGRLHADDAAHLRGLVQPFLEPYSRLLGHALAAVEGPANRPLYDAGSAYAPGEAQPAWATLLRSGQMHVLYDGRGWGRVFAPGDSSKGAYEDAYGVLRHVLTAMLPPTGEPLHVEVYAYQNDYASQQLRFSQDPHVVEGRAFARSPDTTPLDLRGLERFFAKGGALIGGKLRDDTGLVLFARESSLAPSFSPTLADLAVVYRACFQARDSQAYVSLDPSEDPTRVNVNFGGYLEDTRAGRVVLEADKRFKTITTGLDPNSMVDLRERVRSVVPAFVTSAERQLCDGAGDADEWQGTRFWYYPETVEVDTGFDGKSAVITAARFTADAERSRDDYDSTEEFDRRKRMELDPAVRASIADLNGNYDRYAALFGELAALDEVARLFAVCAWLAKADTEGFDLDSLLSVRLPESRTKRVRRKLVASSRVAYVAGRRVTKEEVQARSVVVSHRELLDKSVDAYFETTSELAEWLAKWKGGAPGTHRGQARAILADVPAPRIRDLLRTREAVRAFAEYAASSADAPPMPPSVAAIKADESRLAALEAELDALARRMKQSTETHNALVPKYSRLAERYNALLARHNSKVKDMGDVVIASVLEVGGGIELRPDKFGVRRRPRSTELTRFLEASADIGTEWTDVPHGERWIRNRALPGGSELPQARLPTGTRLAQMAERGDRRFTSYNRNGKGSYWAVCGDEGQEWRDQTIQLDGTVQARMWLPKSRELHVAEYARGAQVNHVVTAVRGAEHVVLQPAERDDLLSPTLPPTWSDAP